MKYYVSVIQNTKNGENRKSIVAYNGQELGEDVAKTKALALYHNEMSTAMGSPDIYATMVQVINSKGGILVIDIYGDLAPEEE